MLIKEYDIKSGVSIFQEKDVVTEIHSHPALELIIATQGTFSVSTRDNKYDQLLYVIIPPNIKHALNAMDCEIQFIFIEPEYSVISKILNSAKHPYSVSDIIILDPADSAILSNELISSYCHDSDVPFLDVRILNCLKFILSESSQDLNISDVAQHVHLSSSRLSHLFKEQIGISCQKYIIWTKLKMAIEYYRKGTITLTQAALQAGFYDSAHFSKHFKEMLGVKPSLVYNKDLKLSAQN